MLKLRDWIDINKINWEQLSLNQNAIELLNSNRELLHNMQIKSHATVASGFNVYKNTNLYVDVFKKYATSSDSPRHHHVSLKIGSRLDQKWLPSFLTLILRKCNPFKFSKIQK